MQSSNRKRLHHIQWRTFEQWRRTQKWNIFLFTSSGNKQKTTVHMRDGKKFNERVNDCWPRRYDCEIDMKKRMNGLMISLILHDAWWWNHSLSFHICCNERNKWMFYGVFQKRKDLWMMFHCWEHMKQQFCVITQKQSQSKHKKVKGKQNREETEEQIQQQKSRERGIGMCEQAKE